MEIEFPEEVGIPVEFLAGVVGTELEFVVVAVGVGVLVIKNGFRIISSNVTDFGTFL